MSSGTLDILYVTGGDVNFFVPALILRESLAAQTDRPLKMADFGLTEPQRTYLRSHDWLLEAPDLDLRGHAWNGKAALSVYLEQERASDTVWLDADTLVLGDIETALNKLVAASPETTLFSTPDFGTRQIQDFFDRFRPVDFTQAVSDAGINPSETYLNSGVFLCRGRSFYERWQNANEAINDSEVLFEQNAFNVAARSEGISVSELDATVWNLHGDTLGTMTVSAGDPPAVRSGGVETLVVHATSEDGRHHITNDGKLSLGDHQLPFFMKWFRDETLKDHQFALLVRHLNAHFDEMVEFGVIEKA